MGLVPVSTLDVVVGSERFPSPLVAVLAGGLARRMGSPKAAVSLCGRPLIDYPLAAASEAGLPAVVVAKRGSELPALAVAVVREPDSPRHPLCGIVAALRQACEPVLAVGCDMPFVNAALLRRLAGGHESQTPGADPIADARQHSGARRRTSRGMQTTVARVEGRLQPLPGLYLPADLPVLEGALHAQASLRATLGELDPGVLEETELRELGEPRRLYFSVNDRRDLRFATRWLAD